MQAVAPFVVMILLLAIVFYLARWDANRVKGKR
jgi:cytochrome oxidase assembly protein ShyY1